MTRDDCLALDAADPLASYRGQFLLPPGVIYLNGNSLGALPAATPAHVAAVVRAQWGDDLVTGWNKHGWIDAPLRLGAAIAPLIGAPAADVIVADTVSINLFKIATAALRLRPGRRTIVMEQGDFPTDAYVMQGLQDLLGDVQLRIVPPDAIVSALDESVAVLLLSHVHYKTGARWNMAALTEAAHARGALALWDLCHSAGAIAVDLAGCDVDFAVGCGYKFFNAGPGAPGFAYVAARHQAAMVSPLTGWLGHASPFVFEQDFEPAPGIRRLLCSSPSIVAAAALESAMTVWQGVAPAALEAKAGRLGDVFIDTVAALCPALRLLSPRRADERGAQVSFCHADGYAMMQALIARGVIGDFRAPDVVRFGLAPLTTSFVNVHDAAVALAEVLDSQEWRQKRFAIRSAVT